MISAAHDLARAFFAALSAGNIADELLTDDMTGWTTTSGTSERARYQGGVRLLDSLFPDGIAYSVYSLTAEEDRVAAEVTAKGVLASGETFANTYVFVLRLREGKIAAVAEHFNPDPVRTQLAPLIQAALAKQQG